MLTWIKTKADCFSVFDNESEKTYETNYHIIEQDSSFFMKNQHNLFRH